MFHYINFQEVLWWKTHGWWKNVKMHVQKGQKIYLIGGRSDRLKKHNLEKSARGRNFDPEQFNQVWYSSIQYLNVPLNPHVHVYGGFLWEKGTKTWFLAKNRTKTTKFWPKIMKNGLLPWILQPNCCVYVIKVATTGWQDTIHQFCMLLKQNFEKADLEIGVWWNIHHTKNGPKVQNHSSPETVFTTLSSIIVQIKYKHM